MASIVSKLTRLAVAAPTTPGACAAAQISLTVAVPHPFLSPAGCCPSLSNMEECDWNQSWVDDGWIYFTWYIYILSASLSCCESKFDERTG
ncbi:hypothetical protein BRADI_3g42355v3 [Brachypodium distachyon]|uniref:Uncharacterized protein n=1 Tax=Brachypodium distachyon TaxID=15368 RepID=A0A2K2D2Q8_BRADI|nr:hypothetical protein BRADI_3g42355v3 [Brachypodium distachyon]